MPRADDPPPPEASSIDALHDACREAPLALDACQVYLRAAVRTDPEVDSRVAALALAFPESWVARYVNAELAFHHGRIAEADAGYREAAQLAERTRDDRGVAAAAYARALLALRAGDTAAGERLLEHALELARRTEDRTLLSRSLYQLARRQRAHGRYADELATLREVLALADPAENDQTLRVAAYALGECLRRLGQHAAAAERFEAVLALSAEADDGAMEAAAAMALGMTLVDEGRSGALDLFRRAAGAARRGGREEWSVHAEILAGVALLRAGDVPAARRELEALVEPATRWSRLRARSLLYLAEAERLSSALDAAEGRYQEAERLAIELELPEERRDAAMGLAALYRARGDPERAVAAARRAEALVESMRANLSTLDERTHFLHARANTYRILAASLAELRPADLDGPFAAIERAHARTLREIVAARSGTASVAPPRLAELAARLGPADLLVEFLLGEEESTLLVVDRGAASLHALAPRRDLERAAATFREALVRPLARVDARLEPEADFRRFAGAGFALFHALLGPVADRVATARRLLVVPDRRLHELPFEALLEAPPDAGAPIAFLGRRVEIAYLPAASFLGPSTAPASPVRALVVAAGQADPELDLLPLRHALDEARAVASAYGEADRELLAGDAATLAALDRALGQPREVLHLGAHALLHPAFGPRILLAQSGGAPHVLDAATIARLDRVPPVVVLSACDTAGGELVGGEGILGLVRALSLAGSTEVVASLWSVDDAKTVPLMARLHAALSRGRPASEGLLEARRAALDGAFVHPFYWSAFVTYGAEGSEQPRSTAERASAARPPPS